MKINAGRPAFICLFKQAGASAGLSVIQIIYALFRSMTPVMPLVSKQANVFRLPATHPFA